jgi:hypothetical protein
MYYPESDPKYINYDNASVIPFSDRLSFATDTLLRRAVIII